MLKLEMALDPQSPQQMLALANFAQTLAAAATGTFENEAARELSKISKEEAAPVVAEMPAPSIPPADRQVYKSLQPEPVAEEEKPKRRRRTKTELEEDQRAGSSNGEAVESETAEGEAVAEEVETEDAEEEKPAAKSSNITLDDIRRVVAEKKETHFQILKFKLKEDFGVSKTTDLDPKDYAAFYNYVNGL